MAIKSYHHSIKVVFEQNHTFEVPKYQRGYAWDEEAIEDFVEDITKCQTARIANDKKHHFFGGIVTVPKNVPNSSRSNYEVIDGQQRLASFVMLAAVIVRCMLDIVGDLVKKDALSAEEKKAKTFLDKTIESLKGLYLAYKDNIELEYVEVPKLTLSKADDEFFQKIISGGDVEATRASHERIQVAWTRLEGCIAKSLANSHTAWEKAKHLQILVNSVLAEDCTVIFMCSETRSEAYQIFQVLNDRGVHLTDGDLLRASTMELLDSKAHHATQDTVAAHWDRILAYPPGDIDSYLRWYFSSLEGKRPKSSNLADQFLEFRFHCKDKNSVDEAGAKAILEEAKRLDKEFAQLRTLGDGEWPYSDHAQVTSWDRERLRMLVIHLKHTNAMPLLLSLGLLEAKHFSAAVSAIERFVFRYKTVGNAHIGPMTELYLRHAKKIRGPDKYSIKGLRTDLAELAEKEVPDGVFEARLREIKYSPRGGNGPIRYLLITLEDYSKWYEQGAQGTPRCKDKTKVFDFSNTTLEHVYPQSAQVKDQDAKSEKIKHTIGNLTIFGPDDNDKLANKPFPDKRHVFQQSNLNLNREIGKNKQWTSALIKKRTDLLVEMAKKVFTP